MDKKGVVYRNGVRVGTLEHRGAGYVFTYDREYLEDASLPPIALSFPKRRDSFHSPILFPFFFGLLSEGDDKGMQCAILKIDGNDHFTRLLKTAGLGAVGPVTVTEER